MQHIKQIQSQWAIPFFTLWTGQALSQLGSRAASFALIWWLTKETGSATVLATVSLVAFLPGVVLGPILGSVVDRWSRRTAMMIADATVALATAWLATQFWQGSMQVWHIYLVTFISALGGTVQFTAMTASTSLMVPDEHLPRVQGANQTLFGLLNIAGPVLGASLLSFLSISQIMGLDVVTATFAIAPLFFIKIPHPQQSQTTSDTVAASILGDLQEGARFIWGWSGLRGLIIIGALLNFIVNPTMTLMPLLITDHFGGEAIRLSMLEAGFGVGTIIGGIALAVWGGFRRQIVTGITGILGMGVGLFIVGVVPAWAFWLALVGMFIFGVSNALTNGALIAMLQTKVPADMQGRIFAVLGSSLQAMTLIGFMLAGPLTDIIGIQTWFVVSGVVSLLLAAKMSFTPAIMQIAEQTVEHPPSEASLTSTVVA